MSLDVSPDGRTIVFDLLGDLYTIPITGGRAVQITSGMAFDSQPRFSPDGRRIAFTSDRDGWVNVWIASRDGTGASQVTRLRWSSNRTTLVSSPEWTPDGTGIIVAEQLHGSYSTHLTEYAVNGASVVRLTRDGSDGAQATSEYRGAAFGPDSQFVYAAVRSRTAPEGYWQIARIDRRTGASIMETSANSGVSAMRPALSPDGRYLVFGAPSGEGTGLRIRDLASDREWWLVRKAQQSVIGPNSGSNDSRDLLPGSSFTPDSRSLVTSYNGRLWRIEISTGAISAIPFTAEIRQRAGPLVRFEYGIEDTLTVHAIRNPQISPDGTRVVFSALDRVWLADLPDAGPASDTTSPRRLTRSEGGEYFPTWSPDGKHVAYATWTDAEGGALYQVRVDGTEEPRPLTTLPGFYTKPVYSRSGTELWAVRGQSSVVRVAALQWKRSAIGDLQIVRIPLSGAAVQVIGPYNIPDLPAYTWKAPAFVYSQLHVSHDPDCVYVYDREQGLLARRIDGSGQRVLVREVTYEPVGTSKSKAAEVLLSPSGRAALAIAPGSNQPYLFTVRNGNTETPSSVSLSDRDSPHKVGRWQLSPAGADFIGWTDDERAFFSAGNALFLAEHSLGQGMEAPKFRSITLRLQAPRDIAGGSLLLRGARIVTMRSHEILNRGDLLIRDGRIAAVGQTGAIDVPPETEVMNVTGLTILPGYVDVHSHVGARIAYGTHVAQEPRLLVELAHGVTTLRDPLGYGPDLMSYAERAAAGDLVAPRIFSVSSGLHSASFGDGSNDDLDQTRRILRLWAHQYHSETMKQYLAGGRRTRQLIAMAARELGLTPTSEGHADTAMDLTTAIDGYGSIEHLMPVTPQFRDVTQFIARTRLIQTPTIGLYLGWRSFLRKEDPWADPRLRRFLPEGAIADARDLINEIIQFPPVDEAVVRDMAAPFAKVMEAGGCVAMGSHGNIPGIGAHYELWYLARGGMSNYDVLRAGTICGAEAIGHRADFGSLERGKLADLQILSGNPLDDIKNTRAIRYVMKNGRLYAADTLDEIWPRTRVLPRPYWDSQQP